MRIDADVHEWFQSFGERGYSTRINAVLRAAMEEYLATESNSDEDRRT